MREGGRERARERDPRMVLFYFNLQTGYSSYFFIFFSSFLLYVQVFSSKYLSSLSLLRHSIIVFPELRKNSEAKQWCVNLKSSLAMPRDAQGNERLYNMALPFLDQCRPPNHAKGFMWLGITDEVENGVWTDLEVGGGGG